jgi:medium-chain acyl-[acyl-carrier-protein] hydrolase
MTAAAVSTPWVPGFRASPATRLRLFCFPYSGGGASVFAQWRDGLVPGVEVCPVELPGRGRRMPEAAITRMEPLVEAAAAGLRPLLDRPFAFFGHSMGALLSFELARRLRADHGLAPEHLFVSAHVAPQTAAREEMIHSLPEPELVARLQSLNGTPPEVLDNPELRSLLLPVLRADFSICDHYRLVPGEPLDCGITAFGGLQDLEVPRADLDAWREQTTGPFALRMFPGDHFFLNTARPTLLWAIASELTRVLQRPAKG